MFSGAPHWCFARHVPPVSAAERRKECEGTERGRDRGLTTYRRVGAWRLFHIIMDSSLTCGPTATHTATTVAVSTAAASSSKPAPSSKAATMCARAAWKYAPLPRLCDGGAYRGRPASQLKKRLSGKSRGALFRFQTLDVHKARSSIVGGS